MTSVRLGLVALPVVTFVLTLYAVRPVASAVGPVRLAAARAAVLAGAFGVASVELLSALGWLTGAGVLVAWAVALGAAAAAARWRQRRDGALPSIALRERVRSWRGDERAIAAAVLVLVGAELVLALASPPNTYDSQTYHLPRIEHWAWQGSVGFYPTGIHRQITYPPGAEFLLLHLRLLTGVDTLYNLLQWGSGVLCLVLVTRLAAQLGVPRRGQLLSALVVASVPMVVLQSSSTQTDLVAAAWVTCVTTLVLDGVGRTPLRRPDVPTALLIGGATGLIVISKPTGGLLAGPLLVWWTLAQLRRGWPRRRAVGLLAGAVGLVAVAALALSGPQFVRMYETFGSPLGPGYVRGTLSMQRHDPGSIVVNALRIAHTALEVPAPPVNRWTADRVTGFAHLLGRDPGDPRTTFYGQAFPDESWYPHEDKAALPLHALLLLIGAGAATTRGARAGGDRRLLVYVGALTVALLAYAVIFKWQPWGNRLLLFTVVAAGPLSGAWLHGVFSRGRAWARRVSVAAVVLAVVAGILSVAYGYPRRLVGADSALTRSELDARFAVRPGWLAGYERAAAAVNATGARRVGLVLTNDAWEYPWHYLLTARDLRSLQSPVPDKLPPATASEVDAIVCTGPFWFCRPFAPPGWAYTQDGEVAWAVPVRT
jgi:4-amino-4-deoxy-L-arabinose transferase-like glycosyltransferase